MMFTEQLDGLKILLTVVSKKAKGIPPKNIGPRLAKLQSEFPDAPKELVLLTLAIVDGMIESTEMAKQNSWSFARMRSRRVFR